ncbi:AMP-dependent synthetase/ligase [endosymbiont of unidentified scaly snail isolate Monju]|uniref:AMP-dependent synthetase/ligase n=1 Tax=endosymbiont of unidentified scaly snail isolate Monju TaxID=1248727 RepID=UPI000389221E|nr:long-chain fatty acid--CoA ligase [endosymbiont of unidentified scaly snail isolate Monju]BAN69069.1 long-chain acyl-CoA synthetase [endosymbiont of unidentified scaly snail isolate Monju]
MEREQDIISLEAAPTLAHAFHERVLRTPDQVAWRDWRDWRWTDHTWAESQAEVALWQHAMQADGLQPGERIAILCSNRWEWVLCDQAAQGLGLVSVPLYTNDRAENIGWILKDAGVRWLFLEKAEHWERLQEIRDRLGTLTRIVTGERVEDELPNVIDLDAWLTPARTLPTPPEYVLDPGAPGSLAGIVYTSGTTGRPKGVMLCHHNILWEIHAALQQVPVYPQDMLLSFLPLSHTLERTAGYYLPIVAGTPVTFSRGIPQLADDLAMVKPTLMISVPRIFERVYGRISARVDEGSVLKQWLFHEAVKLGWRRFEWQQGRARWTPGLLLHPLLDHLVGRKIRERLGGRLRFTVCGGAALGEDVARLFIGLGVPILQGYGLTETSPVIAVNTLEDNLPVSVGRALPGIEVRTGENNELLTRSPAVMLGYWNNPEATARIIDDEGWLHTGDQVAIDEQGHIRITGRIKEIIVLSNGEKVPPADMENAIALDELIDQVMVIGEGRPYLSALVVPNPEALEKVARELHLDPANQAIYDDEYLREVLMEHIEERTRDFPGYARIRQIAILDHPWIPDNGLMTPTLKLRRDRILQQCHDLMENLYAGH